MTAYLRKQLANALIVDGKFALDLQTRISLVQLLKLLYIHKYSTLKLIPTEIGADTILDHVNTRLSDENSESFMEDLTEFSEKFNLHYCL